MAPGYFDGAVPATESATDLGFTVLQQRVFINVDFANQSINGTTEISLSPSSKELKIVRLNCRQAIITEARVEGKSTTFNYVDPYSKLKVRGKTTVHQHQDLRNRIEPYIKSPPEPELSVTVPSKLAIRELPSDAPLPNGLERQDSEYGEKGAETPQTSYAQEPTTRFAPIRVELEFKIDNFRDGLHFVGCKPGDSRFPHVYTRNAITPGNMSSIFPCIDDFNTRCMWEISIRCPRTLGDAFRKPRPAELDDQGSDGDVAMTGNDHVNRVKDEYLINLSEEERALDLTVIASADLTDDILDPADPTMHTVQFRQENPVCAHAMGFVVGPYEHVDLSEFRELDQDDKLGQNAVHVHGYCLPGRADELRNTCMPMAKCIDDFTVNYGSYPFASYKLIFVDDLVQDVAHTASLSICSNRLLFPEDIIETLDSHTRILVHALASQYVGVHIIAKEPTDMWVITGISGFMRDNFMKKLAGNNEHRFRQKLASEKVFELDYERYSIHQLGAVLDIDPSEYDFLALKSPLVLFILDRRLAKASGSAGMPRIISRLILNQKTGELENGEISTDWFQRLCEKLGHQKLDSFWRQWVYGAGCPIFHCTQKFNKKKLVVDMEIKQLQMERKTKPKLETSNFMREIKEQVSEAWAPGIQPVFTGPMTIRIHEADGTPYEHIVEIKEAYTKVEVPYNTKYKRLKRSKRAKERALANTGVETSGDAENDVLLYCLGDVLNSEEEVKEWRLADWAEEEERKMNQESYEWIRMDADFEWIGKIHLVMPTYMYVSQLQQDRDVVAQYESLQQCAASMAHPLQSTIFIRTLMDTRYFHGIRTLAAAGLAKCAVQKNAENVVLDYVGLFHLMKAFEVFFGIPGSPMPRPNDFSDRVTYIIQCAIPKAMARIRDERGKVPMSVRRFFVDKLKFNDNSNNEAYSDNFYVATLMNCLADALVASENKPGSFRDEDGYDDDDMLDEMREDDLLKKEAINELERYRRIDEWIASYQNIYSVTAMNCMQKLQQAGAIPNQIRHFMQYTQPSNADDVRLKAFSCMVDLKIFKQKPSVLKYLLFSISDDTSPYFRDRLSRVLGQALGSIAIKDEEPKKPAPKPLVEADSGLVLEQEVPVEPTFEDMELVEKSPPELALVALKTALENDAVFKQTLWQVIQSPMLSIAEVVAFLDIAALLYEPSTALMVHLRYPHYYTFKQWEKREVQAGQKSKVLALQETPRFRTTPVNGLSLAAWHLVQQYGLKWTGPLSKAVKDYQKDVKVQDREQKAQIAALQSQIQRQQSASQAPKPSLAMSPPPLPTPVNDRPGPKISLKRKQSTTSDATPSRAGSPKRQQFSPPAPKVVTATPKTQRSPSISKTKAPAPSAAAAPVRPKIAKPKRESKIVRLKIAHPDRVRSILSKKPRPTLKVSTADVIKKSSTNAARDVSAGSGHGTPASVLPSKSATPATGGASNSDFFASPAVQSAAAGSASLGSFRFYGGGNGDVAKIKAEDSDPTSAISPMSHRQPKNGIGSGNAPPKSGTPKLNLSRAGTPGHNGGPSRAGTPKPLSGAGGSRAGTPVGVREGPIIKKGIPPPSKAAAAAASGAVSAGSTSSGGNTPAPSTSSGIEPERKKLKLKLGRKPGT